MDSPQFQSDLPELYELQPDPLPTEGLGGNSQHICGAVFNKNHDSTGGVPFLPPESITALATTCSTCHTPSSNWSRYCHYCAALICENCQAQTSGEKHEIVIGFSSPKCPKCLLLFKMKKIRPPEPNYSQLRKLLNEKPTTTGAEDD